LSSWLLTTERHNCLTITLMGQMKLRLLAMGTRGDVQPYVALGLGLQRVGYDVTLGTTADFRSLVEDSGLPCISTQQDLRGMLAHYRSARAARWGFFRMILDVTPELAAGADALIYSAAFLLSAPHVGEYLGIPALPTALQPFLTPTRTYPAVGLPALPLGGGYNRLTYALAEASVTLLLSRRINRWRAQILGLPRYRGPGLFSALRQPGTPTLYGFSPTVLPKPPDWGAHIHVTGYWFLPPQAWQPPEALHRFLAAGAAPVYMGFGSIAYPNPSRLMHTLIEAIQHAKVRAIIASGWSGLQPDNLPENVLLIDSAPHDWLFPRVAAAVHHGGAGTLAASLRAGLPTLLIPFMADQPLWSRRVLALGVGPPPIPATRLSGLGLAQALRQMLDDEPMRQRAQALGTAIQAEDGVASAVRVISKWVAEA
jgi:sterol 3beta-glucosyltransferase